MPGGLQHFRGGGRLHEFNQDTSSDRATVTTAELQVYGNGTTGDDDNDGLTAAAPKKTRAATLALIPDIVKHNCAVNFAGSFTTAEQINFTRVVEDAMIVVTGADAWTIVDDNSGSKYTTTGASVSSLVVAAAAWTVDAHMGLYARILTGAAAGEIIMVQKNTADTITPQKDFAANPGVGATFELVEPATNINVSAGTDSMSFSIIGSGTGTYKAGLYLQRLTTKGTKPSITVIGCTAYVYLSNLCLRSTKSTALWFLHTVYGATTEWAIDPTTFELVWPQTTYGGVFVNGGSGPGFKANTCLKLWFDALISKTGSEIQNINLLYVSNGWWLKGANRFRSLSTDDSYGLRGVVAGYATGGAVNAAGAGITFEGCSLVNVEAGLYSDSLTHGLEAVSSYVRMDGVVAGASNGGFGMYAHTGSDVTIVDGSAPTLTGMDGDFSFDGTTEASSWADIDAGTAISDITEMSMCKEV